MSHLKYTAASAHVGISHEALASGSLADPESGSLKISGTPRSRQRAKSTIETIIGSETISEGLDGLVHAAKDFVHAPAARYEWNEDHTKVFAQGGHLEENWLAEFLDLILVAAFIKLGDGLFYCGLSFHEYFFVSIEFAILFKTRYMIDEFMWHFFMDDTWNQFLFFLFIVGVYIMTLMVSIDYDYYTKTCDLNSFHLITFFSGLMLTRFILCLFWSVELYFDTKARDSYYMIVVRNLITILLCVAGMVLNTIDTFDAFNSYYIMLAITINEFYGQFYKGIHKKPLIELNQYWPFNKMGIDDHDHDHERLFECDEELHTVQNRCGVFVLIVLGESVIQLLIPSFDMNHGTDMIYLTIMGLLLVWSVARQFFDAAQRVPNGHALRRCMQSGTQWIVMHCVSGWFTFIMGIGLKFLYEDLREGKLATVSHKYAISLGSTGGVMCFTYMRFLHKGWGEWPSNQNRLLAYFLRFSIGILHFLVTWWDGLHENDPGHIVTCHAVIAIVMNTLDLYQFKSEHYLMVDLENETDDEESDENSKTDDGGEGSNSSQGVSGTIGLEKKLSGIQLISKLSGISLSAELSSSNLFSSAFDARRDRAAGKGKRPSGGHGSNTNGTSTPTTMGSRNNSSTDILKDLQENYEKELRPHVTAMLADHEDEEIVIKQTD